MSDQDFSHLYPAAASVAGNDDDFRIGWIKRGGWIGHPEAKKIQDKISKLAEEAPSNRMENMLLIGESGIGKTVLLDKAIDLICGSPPFSRPAMPKDFSKRKIVKITMPYKPMENRFFQAIFKEFGAPQTQLNVYQEPNLLPLVSEILTRSGTRVLVIDEINSLMGGTLSQQKIFLQLLRSMSTELRISLVLSGTPDAQYALRSDLQLSSRFYTAVLPTWKNGPDLQKFINLLVQTKPLRKASAVEDTQLCKLVADRSSGITSAICKAIEYAAVEAIRSGREMIDFAALQDDGPWGGPRPDQEDITISAPISRIATPPKKAAA